MEPATEEPRAIERGGDKRGVQVRQLGRGEEKRGREESAGREEERKRPKVEHGKGFQVADHCMSLAPLLIVADASQTINEVIKVSITVKNQPSSV
jgi:hypothetical protein